MALGKATLSSQQLGKNKELWELSGAHTGYSWRTEGPSRHVGCTPTHPPLHFRGRDRDSDSSITFLDQNSWAQGAYQ